MTQPFDPWERQQCPPDGPEQDYGQQAWPPQQYQQRAAPSQGYHQPWRSQQYHPQARQQRIGSGPALQLPALQQLDVRLQQSPAAPFRKRRRVFIWVFLAIQVLFVVWIIAGAASTSHSGADAHNQAVSYCRTNWQGLYNSYAYCVTSYGNTLNAASDTGKGIAFGVIIRLWVATDVILGVSCGIYRLASRGNR